MRSKTVAAIILVVISLSCATKPDSTTDSGELKPRNSQLAVGEMAPDFTLEDHNNQKVTLSSARGARANVLVFYRGYW